MCDRLVRDVSVAYSVGRETGAGTVTTDASSTTTTTAAATTTTSAPATPATAAPATVSMDVLLRQFFPVIMKPLLKRFADPSEKCRELAIGLVCVVGAGGVGVA